jgi:hypothetical protein
MKIRRIATIICICVISSLNAASAQSRKEVLKKDWLECAEEVTRSLQCEALAAEYVHISVPFMQGDQAVVALIEQNKAGAGDLLVKIGEMAKDHGARLFGNCLLEANPNYPPSKIDARLEIKMAGLYYSAVEK